ncbi:MAG: hydroxyneurosporene methyltransferase [Chloroflexi bacterium]|nr:hydroxyneurosporene methyltransferase [Chloroflexota bacterium]
MQSEAVQSLLTVAGGYIVSRCTHVVAELGVADALDGSPRSAAELADAVGASPTALYRVMRLLSAHGIFSVQNESFAHTPASRLLRTDHPQSMRAFVRMMGLPPVWSAYGHLMHSVRTGQPAADEIAPGGIRFYAEDPAAAAIFNAAMTAKAYQHIAGILNVYDFRRFGVIGDIGGGRGHLLRAILDSVPTARGVLFELPTVIEEARRLGADRLTFQSGDFFKDALPVCDLYLLMEVVHDWEDSEALAILGSVRRAAPPHATLLLLEQMVADGPEPDWAKTIDIHMLAVNGGRQRALPEYTAMLDQTGFVLERDIDTGAGIAILEARLSRPGRT